MIDGAESLADVEQAALILPEIDKVPTLEVDLD